MSPDVTIKGPVIFENRGVLKITGEDRYSFLQGLVTNDVFQLSAGKPLFAALLSAQGKWLYDFFLIEHNNEIFLEGEIGRLPSLQQKLMLYKLRSQVKIENVSSEYNVLADWNESKGLEKDPTLFYIDPRLPALGGRLLRPKSIPLPVPHYPADIYHAHRLALGVPEGACDMIPDKSIPLECGLDDLKAIDWQKGCYMGQELTARTRYRGLVRKRLIPVKIEGEASLFGTPVFLNEQEVGDMRSSYGAQGIAMIRLEALEQSGEFICGASKLVPFKPDWMRGTEG